MPVNRRYEPGEGYVYVEHIPPVSPKDMIDGYPEVLSHREFNPKMNFIYDHRSWSLEDYADYSAETIEGLFAAHLGDFGGDNKKIAFLIAEKFPKDHYMIRLAEMVASKFAGRFQLRFFHSLSDARDWMIAEQ